MVKTVFTQEGSLHPLAQRCLSNLKNLVAVTRKVTFSSAEGTELVYMHVLHARFDNFYRTYCAVQCSSFFSSSTQIK